jgi:hypothetical protein
MIVPKIASLMAPCKFLIKLLAEHYIRALMQNNIYAQ